MADLNHLRLALGALLALASAPGAAAPAEAPAPSEPLELAAGLTARFPGSMEAILAAARIEHRSGAADRALLRFREALGLDPARIEAREAAGDILSGKGRLAEAEEEYRRAVGGASQDADRARIRLKLGIALCTRGRLDEAERELRGAAAARPLDAPLRYQLAQALLARGEGAPALRELEAARRLGESGSALEYSFARAHQLAGDREAARTALERFRALKARDPPEAEARRRRDADRAAAERRNLALAHLDAAGVYRRHGAPAEAQAHLARAIEDDPALHPARFARARLLEETGDLEGAAADYEALLASVPDPAPLRRPAGALHEKRARALLASPAEAAGRLPELLSWTRRAVELNPSASAHEALAWSLLAAGEGAQARAALREAVRLNPGNADYRARLRALEEAQAAGGGAGTPRR